MPKKTLRSVFFYFIEQLERKIKVNLIICKFSVSSHADFRLTYVNE